MEKELHGKLLTIPEHVAIILDGNGRWAKKRFMPRNYGHSQGAKTVEQICEDAWDIGINLDIIWGLNILQCMHFQQRTGNVQKNK